MKKSGMTLEIGDEKGHWFDGIWSPRVYKPSIDGMPQPVISKKPDAPNIDLKKMEENTLANALKKEQP